MITKENLRNIVKLQREELLSFEKGVERDDANKIDVNLPFARVISGIRRCGKSTLLRQLMEKVKNFYYFNFEDPRAIEFEIEDFEKLNLIFQEEYGRKGYYFFDEIQNIQKWELFVRRLVDLKKSVIITGSNASLISRELGNRLTGRYLPYELFPFSFKEFVKLKNEQPSIKNFEEYLNKGGFPEYLKLERTEILQELFRNVLTRDISIRYKIRNEKTLREMAVYMLNNVGKRFTYNSLKKVFNLGSINSVISFVSHFEDTYMIFTISQFDYSLKKRIVGPKKIYSIDNGLTIKNSSSFFDDKGRLFENLVFINLRKITKEIFYYQEKNECDFVIREGIYIVKAIQVCYDFNSENKDREINGLLEAMKKFKLKEGLILTYDQEDGMKIENKLIKITPVWKWLLTEDKNI